MDVKERVLIEIIRSIYPRYLLSEKRENYSDYCEENIQVGDMVLCTGSGIHDWTVGIVQDKIADSYMVIQEIGTKRLCNVSNEMFKKIDSTIVRNEYNLLEEKEYKLFIKVKKAFKGRYANLFKSLDFNGLTVTLKTRNKWSNKECNVIEFSYNSKTTIKSIKESLPEDKYAEGYKIGEEE